MNLDLTLWATQNLLHFLSTTADGIATLTIVGLLVGAAAGKAARLMLGPVWTFAQAVLANALGHRGLLRGEPDRRTCIRTPSWPGPISSRNPNSPVTSS